MRTRFAFTLSLLFIPATSIAANKHVGTSGAQFLKIGAGARPTAMGDAFVGIADDVNAVYHNPAGLAMLEKPELTALHTQYLQGLNYDFGAFVQPTSHGAFAISAATLKTDDLSRRGADESFQGTFQNQDAAYALAYAHKAGETISLGINTRWIREEIDGASAQTWSNDVGVFKRFHERPLTLGLAIRHFGQRVTFNEESDPLPLTIDGGLGLNLLRNRLIVGADIRHIRDTGLQYGTGAEWHQSIRDKFRYAVRAGYNTAATDSNGTSGVTLGAGMGYRLFDVDFAWVPFGNLGNTFRYALHVWF